MNNERRIYSINLMAYLLLKDEDLMEYTTVHKDEENPNVAYFVVHKNIGDLIYEYKNDVMLKKLFANYTTIRNAIENVLK